jgi:hypothetical protein
MALSLTERQNRLPCFEGSYTVDDDTSDYLILPSMPARKISVSVIPGANTGKVQYTISPIADVVAGSATWFDWASGAVGSNTVDYLDAPVQALRFVASGGEVTFEVLI